MVGGIRRPHTSMGFVSPGPDLVSPDVKIGEDVLNSGFKKHLENFYLKASPADRDKCAELLAALDISDQTRDQAQYLPEPDPGTFTYQAAGLPSNYPAKHRPRTAMAYTGPRDPLNSYTTTYKREYNASLGAPAQAERPQTARHQIDHELSASLGSTTYENEYYSKESRTNPIRTGTSSGNRRNNPHPPEAFMVWKIRKDQGERSRAHGYPDLTDDVMDRVMRGKISSTYQEDYLGIPQGYQVKDAFPETQDWKSRIPYTLDSSTRHSFQKPDLKPELKCNTYRYGCNKKKHVAAAGVVPTVSNRHMDIKTRTTYEREYNANNGALVRSVRDLGRNLAPQPAFRPHPPASRSGSLKYSYNPRPYVPSATACVDNSVY